ncbi:MULTISPECIES: PTS sugar transporter subunit IIB [unclassified Enterococcus]|uniref:PTS sugar transporter subunit IIB n=1 Tax=unclassified Enterococcus TaxID=2608891 RepID=UPI000A35691E|nr:MULTISPECIES: hypothetical protein [unclassified Enterococcus]OTO77379.1 hypothetical protein A5865_001255 [Enterococcus sp. 12E11_DIV0728]OUZ16446.1 hypothetical protein A5868_001367 [Enterococcus sp. 12F9_DIV0723]
MNVLLVCTSGITTSVLASKLQTYATKMGKSDLIWACKIQLCEERLQEVDVILIAPQARYCSESIETKAKEMGLAICYLEEKDFAFSQVEVIYNMIETGFYHKTPKMLTVSRSAIALTPKSFIVLVVHAVQRCIPMFLLGLPFFLIAFWAGIDIFMPIWQASGGMIGFYLMFAIGYEYGEMSDLGGGICGVICMWSSMILFPIEVPEQQVEILYQGNTDYLYAEIFSFKYCLLLSVLAVLVVFIMYAMDCLIQKYPLRGILAIHPVVTPVIRLGLVMIVFVILHVLLKMKG